MPTSDPFADGTGLQPMYAGAAAATHAATESSSQFMPQAAAICMTKGAPSALRPQGMAIADMALMLNGGVRLDAAVCSGSKRPPISI